MVLLILVQDQVDTVTSFNPFITDVNAVRGQETEYCTMNPVTNVQGVTLSDGNLKCTCS